MSNITFCWELGGGYGHLAGFKSLAQLLLSKNHNVSASLRNADSAHNFFAEMSVNYFPAPKWQSQIKHTAPTISYADIIARHGYDSKESLLPLVQQWRKQFRECETELIIADHSPTALLAARTLNLPSTLLGNGFFAPPAEQPLPSLTPWLDTQPEFLTHIEDNVLRVINSILSHFDATTLDYFYQLFEVKENFLCTLPELDHYNNREPDAYWGPLFDMTTGVPAHWPKNQKKHIFIYTKSSYVLLHNLLTSLEGIDADILVHCSGMDEKTIRRYSTNNVRFSAHPIQLQSIENQADLVICHAGHGTVAASLLMGIPLVLLPTQLEQLMTASKLSHLKLAGFIGMKDKQPDFVPLIESILHNAECRQRANLFANYYKGFDPKEQLEEIVFSCEAILANQ